MPRARFSDGETMEVGRCQLKSGHGTIACDDNLRGVWWFRSVPVDRNGGCPLGLVKFGDRCNEQNWKRQKVSVCGSHSDMLWGMIRSNVAMGLDHFEIGLQDGLQ